MSNEAETRKGTDINYGVFSILFLIASALGFKFSLDGILLTLSSVLSLLWKQSASDTHPMYDNTDLTYFYMLLLASCIGYIISIAFAGAGLAAGRGNIFAGLTIGIAMLPILYAGYAIFNAGLV